MKADTKRHGLALISAVLGVFLCMVAFTQVFDEECWRNYGVWSLPEFPEKVWQLARTDNIMVCDAAADPVYGACRQVDLTLAPNTRIYMDEMLGPTNAHRCTLYASLVYYVFPREVATSLDQPAQFTRGGFVGRGAKTQEELAANGFYVSVVPNEHIFTVLPLRGDPPLRIPASPDWFPSRRDAVIAFLLPLFTALTGLELMRLLFAGLHARMPLLERLGCGFGLGMMTVAAVTLAVKLCGFHGYDLVLAATCLGAVFAAWRNRRVFLTGIPAGLRTAIRNPVTLAGGLVFLLVFSAAGVLGLAEVDAACGWLLKAKIQHQYAGSEMIRWFSEPRLALAHLDYPPLVPALHAATFDSIGRVDEFVTKFWPAWMLLLLVGALASLNRGGSKRWNGPSFFLLALVLLPAMRLYTGWEGSTLPMILFTCLGFVQCALAQVEQDRARLGLGLTLLWGAALAKFDGLIFLVAAAVWMLFLLPVARPVSLRLPARGWRVLAFCLAAAFPYVWFRAQIPALHFESHWAGNALAHPGITLANWPVLLTQMTARWFVSQDLGTWGTEGGHLRWLGKWEGFPSLYHHYTLGLPWMACLLTLALWVIQPARRRLIVWLLAVNASVLLAFSFVFASFVSTASLARVLYQYTDTIASSRYLFPILVAWSATMVTLLFRDPPS